MPRTTSDLVKGVITVKATDDLTPFIASANALVTGVCVDGDDFTYTDTLLELIERWLSGHFYSVLRGRAKFQSAGKVQQAIESKVDLYLDNSRYGQTAIAMDYHGRLASYNNALKKASDNAISIYNQSVVFLGTLACERLPDDPV